jgi:branched-chain amino acid transport system substrate-binding protein
MSPRSPRRWLTLLILATALPALACRVESAPFDVARVAVAAPLTGESAPAGRDVTEGAHLAVEQWNEAGGVHGLRLEMVTVDEGEAPARLSADARMLAAVGYTSPAAAARVRDAFSAATAPATVLLAHAGAMPPGEAALAPAPDQVAEVAAAAIAFNFGPSSIAIVASGTAEDIAAAQAFSRYAAERGLQVRATFTLAAIETNYARVAGSVQASGAQLVYVTGHGYDAGALWGELRPRDSRVKLILAPGGFDEGFRRTAGGFLEDVNAIDLTIRPGDAPDGPDFIRAYSDRFGHAPTALAARAFDATRLALRAIADAAEKGTPTRAAVRAALAGVTRFPGVLRVYPLAGGTPSGWKLALYRLDRDGVPLLVGEPEIKSS